MSPFAHAVGLALLQFVWQGAAIGASTALLLITLRRSTPQARYAVACLGLAVMLMTPIATAVGHLRDIPAASTAASIVSTRSLTATSAPTTVTGADSRSPKTRPAILSNFGAWVAPHLPVVVLIWTGGVLVLALRLLGGWLRVERIRRRATPLPAQPWPETVRRMADRLGVTRRMRLVESALVDVPAVIGHLKPVIVLPASALAGLSPAHLEAIVAHELAHVRRGDYLVNVVQSLVETLLFYHPAVWWVSRQIRLEREHCCDDVAVSLCADRVVYARALASLEELRTQAPALAMGAGGGELLNRVRRLVDPRSVSGPRISGGFAMCVLLTVLLTAASGHININGMPASDHRSPNAIIASVVDRDPVPVASARVESPTGRQRGVSVPKSRPQQTATPPRAQQAPVGRGGISGVVRDPQGGVMPGVTVTVSSWVSPPRTAITNARGQFSITDLPSGAYTLTASLPGFKTSRNTVQLGADANVTANVVLALGSLAETIFVRAAPPDRSAASPINQPRAGAGTAAAYFDLAKEYYRQGRLAEAEAIASQALERLRAEMPDNPAAATPAMDTAGPARVGGDIREPRKLRDVRPIYPGEALAAGAEGIVILEAIISTNGSVRDARILRSVPMLDDAALVAVRQWLFTPTLLNAVPVEVLMTVTVTFSAR